MSARGLFDLHGQVALVTGAAQGLGLAIAEALAAHGARLVLADRDEERLHAVRSRFDAPELLAGDLAQPGAAQALADEALRRCGRIDTLVCNAGIQGPAAPLTDASDEAWEAVMAVNAKAALRLCGRVLPGMAQRRGGSVVLMSSIAGLRGNGAIGLYGLSKAALAQMARNLAVEWGPCGVRVNAISPGLVRTPLAERLIADGGFMQRRLAATPLRRVGEPHEIAGVVVMLAAAAGAFITGQNIVVDGGTLIGDGS